MLAHGSHLVDTAMWLIGDIEEIQARFLKRGGIYSWFADVGFANGCLGHLDLSIGVKMDWHEGFSAYAANGSVLAKTYNPWLFLSSKVDIFHETTAVWTSPLGADGHFYRRQLESFADVVLNKATMQGATSADGVQNVRTLAAIRYSARTGEKVRIADMTGTV